jgi:hypothetical protein
MEQPQARRERLRFEGLDYKTLPDGTTRLEVRLEWAGDLHVGRSSGTGTLEGDLRAAAEATLTAAVAASGNVVRLGLLGIKAVRAFDGRVIIAAVEARAEGRHHKLLGAHALTVGDVPRAAALTVLDALNRVMAPFIGTPPGTTTTTPDAGDGEG